MRRGILLVRLIEGFVCSYRFLGVLGVLGTELWVIYYFLDVWRT